MPLLVRVVHRDAFLVWCVTYLRQADRAGYVHGRLAGRAAFQGTWGTPLLAFDARCA